MKIIKVDSCYFCPYKDFLSLFGYYCLKIGCSIEGKYDMQASKISYYILKHKKIKKDCPLGEI